MDVCQTIRLCITTSEVLTPEDRVILRDAFGVKVVNEYGVSEAGVIVAFENDVTDWIMSHETQFVEVVDDDGSVVPDGQYNKAMPFIRYRSGDIGSINPDKSGEYKVLNNLGGRVNDTIILPSGKVSPGLTFYYISRSILESSGVLREFIIRQVDYDSFVFDIVSDRNLHNSEIKNIKEKMDMYLEPNLKLKINRVEVINRPTSGKIKHFYSEIN